MIACVNVQTTSLPNLPNKSPREIRISIVIPVLNEDSLIEAAVENAWRCGADEVIIADGGSVDQTIARAKEMKCKFVESAPGRGQQLNAGAAQATGDALLFLHVDNSMEADVVEQIRGAMVNDDCVGGGFRQRIDSERSIFRIIESGNYLRAKYQRLVYGDQGLFVRRDVFESLGGFPEIPLMEDFVFSQKLFQGKHKPVMLPGPLCVSARSWEKTGVLKQTIKNWRIAAAHRMGATPESLYQRYYQD